MALSTSGCVGLPAIKRLAEAPIPTTSPIADEVARASANPGPYPNLSDIPAIPTDVRPDAQWKSSVAAVQADRTAVTAEIAANPPLLSDTAGWADSQRRRATPPPAVSPVPADAAETEAYARAMRERARRGRPKT